MRALLVELCDELEAHEPRSAARARLPVGLFRLLAESLRRDDFDHWKVVGWIEGLNDLVYFLDVCRQLCRERDMAEFAAQLLTECQERLYENSYLDELFPKRRPEPARLAARLGRLCDRLASELVQESLFLVPGLPCRWLQAEGRSSWTVPGTLAVNLERSELAGAIAVGLDGSFVRAPGPFRGAKRVAAGRVRFRMTPSDIVLWIGRVESRLCAVDDRVRWDWPVQAPCYIVPPDRTWPRGLTLAPTLVYDRAPAPKTVGWSSEKLAERVREAVAAIAQAWPEGHALLALLTCRIVPLKAKGVVSFSYRHRPGISFINIFDRTQLDLIDDLIHENSHHHLNLLLRKYVLYRGDHNQEIFYSPWRRSLRPLRGILHATFTFTMGALLFEHLSQWGRRNHGPWLKAGLSEADLTRAQFRCLEETESVRYSLNDLAYADRQRGWLPVPGRRLVKQLQGEIRRVERSVPRFERAIRGAKHAAALKRHVNELQQARQTYGPVRASAGNTSRK